MCEYLCPFLVASSLIITVLLSFCLIAAGIVEKFVLTRLPVGHTHEDIDARFGKLWTYFRSTAITTPQEYKTAIEKVFQPGTCKVVDIHAVPDYKGWLKDCLDPKLKHYGKEE